MAVEIVNEWLAQDGWIGRSIDDMNQLDIDILCNIAPVSPDITLGAIERAANGPEGDSFTSGDYSHHTEFVGILRHLAYDPALFDRSVELLCRYALSESDDSTRHVVKSLFCLDFSGTHAPIEARTRIIENMVGSERREKQELAIRKHEKKPPTGTILS
jgi:hypothetical protein